MTPISGSVLVYVSPGRGVDGVALLAAARRFSRAVGSPRRVRDPCNRDAVDFPPCRIELKRFQAIFCPSNFYLRHSSSSSVQLARLSRCIVYRCGGFHCPLPYCPCDSQPARLSTRGAASPRSSSTAFPEKVRAAADHTGLPTTYSPVQGLRALQSLHSTRFLSQHRRLAASNCRPQPLHSQRETLGPPTHLQPPSYL